MLRLKYLLPKCMHIPPPDVVDRVPQAAGPGEGLREVAIFRHNLFRISEPFISDQAQHLRRYRPLYVGRKRFGSPPEGTTSLALEDLTLRPGMVWCEFRR